MVVVGGSLTIVVGDSLTLAAGDTLKIDVPEITYCYTTADEV